MLPLDPVTVLLSIVTCIFLATVIYKQKERVHPNYPPGPKPWPIIGNIPHLNVQKPYLSFQELAKTYGPVYSIKIGLEKMVVLCGYDAVKEALVGQAENFSDRPYVPAMLDFTKGYGIAFSNGQNWKVMKRFTLTTFRDFGVGKRLMEEKINEEANCLVQTFKSYKGEPFDNSKLMEAALCNIIISILFGHRFDFDDPELERLMSLIMVIVRLLGSPISLLYNAFPSILRWLPGDHKVILNRTKELRSLIREMFTKLRNQLDVNNPQNVIDHFLIKQKEEKPDTELYFHDENLTSLVSDLLSAGIETSATTLTWALLLMMKYPEIQAMAVLTLDAGAWLGRVCVIFLIKMADTGSTRRACAWGDGEVALLIKVLDRRDYWLWYRHAHPMEHKRAVLRKVRRLLRSRFGVERSREQIRRKIADLRYKSPQRISNIRRQIRNQRAAARRRLLQSPSVEEANAASPSGDPQQAEEPHSPPSARVSPPDSPGCADLSQRASPTQPNPPTPASSASSSRPQQETMQAPTITAPPPILPSNTISPDGQIHPSHALKDSINMLIQHQTVLERDVRLHGELLQKLVAQLK